MRILHITPDYHPTKGGGELYVKEISERLAARGHDVKVLAMNSRGALGRDGARLQSREVINGVTVNRLANTYKLHGQLMGIRGAHRALGLAIDADRFNMLASGPCSLRTFLVTLRARVDVVAVANWYHGALAYQTSLARRLRRFTFVGIPLFHTERPWARSPLFAQMLARCDAVAALTEHEKRFIEERASSANVSVVGAGVESSLFAHAHGDTIRAAHGIGDLPLVGYVGRMAASKGVVTLIKAMTLVWRQDPHVRLLLAGSGLPTSPTPDGEVGAALAGLAEDERRRIIAIDSFSEGEKPSIFAALDVFAMASVAESFGMAYLEAWMCSKAVIGSRIGSTACVVDETVDGRLVTPEDPADLARTIMQLLSDRAGRERMGRAGYAKTMARYTWDRVVDNVERLYTGAAAERRAQGTTA
jgi:glycosyltransferase involved in cell wall biosynthesis